MRLSLQTSFEKVGRFFKVVGNSGAEDQITAGHQTFSDHFKGMSNHFGFMA